MVRQRGVLLTTYGMVLHNAEVLAEHGQHDPDDGAMWDVMICGEPRGPACVMIRWNFRKGSPCTAALDLWLPACKLL